MTLLKHRSAARIEGRSTVKRFALVAAALGTIVAAGTACWLRACNVETTMYCSVYAAHHDPALLVQACKHEAYIRAGRAALTGILAACVVWSLIVAATARFVLRLWKGREWDGEVANLRKYALITSAAVGVVLASSASITWPSLF